MLFRFDDITFVRTKEAAWKQKPTLANAGLVETVVFEVKDRHRIGGSLFKVMPFTVHKSLQMMGFAIWERL